MRRLMVLAIFVACLPGMSLAAEKYSVRVVPNIDYVPDAAYADDKDKLDLYLPEGRTGFPVIVSLYGGGLRNGDKREETHIGQRFAAAGVGTAVVNYRLSPTVSHPAHVQDAAAAIAWVKRNIKQHGGNPEAIFVIGHSAGAYLTALLALDARYLAAQQLSAGAIRGFIPVSGFFYVDRVAPDRPKDVWGTDLNTWIDASPAKYVRPDAPPILLIYADGDDEWRRKQNEEVAQALRDKGHRGIEIKQVPNRTHMAIWQRIREDEETSRLILEFVAKHAPAAGTAP